MWLNIATQLARYFLHTARQTPPQAAATVGQLFECISVMTIGRPIETLVVDTKSVNNWGFISTYEMYNNVT